MADTSYLRYTVEPWIRLDWVSDLAGPSRPTGKVATCLNEIYFLTLVRAPERLLVLTNPDFHAIFTRVTSGQIAQGIRVELLPLPSAMQQVVDEVTARASKEMSREVVIVASAVEAEEEGERGTDVPPPVTRAN